MTVTAFSAALVAAWLFAGVGESAQTSTPPQPTPIEYDEFGRLPLESRATVFSSLTPENRSRLVREQAERWRKKNAQRLTSEQRTLLAEFIAFSTPERLGPAGPADQEGWKELGARLAAHFTREDGRNAFTLMGEYIPAR